MAELLSSIRGRFACREFTNQLVAGRMIDLILEAGRIAPSAFGMEPWRFVVVRSAEAREKVAAACFNQDPATTAPVLIALVALVEALAPGSAFVEDRLTAEAGGPPPDVLREAYRGLYAQMEAKSWAVAQCNFAAAQMMIQASALDLATCPIGGYDEAALADALNLAPGESPALVLAVGHCAQAQSERRRRKMAEIVEII